MKTRLVPVEKLFEVYDHPAAVLFRTIELDTIYNVTKNINFSEPSLDLGCGDGVISELLFDSHFTDGVDNGEAKDVEEAVKNKRYGKVHLESAEKMSLPSNTFNFVFSNSVIEHIPNNDAVLSEVSRILVPGGYLLFTSPSHLFGKYLFVTQALKNLGLGFLADIYESKRNKMLNHYHIYSYETYKEKLEKNGFKIVDYTYCISQPIMALWDKLTIASFFGRVFKPDLNKDLTSKYKESIIELARKQTPSKEPQANLLILATKN